MSVFEHLSDTLQKGYADWFQVQLVFHLDQVLAKAKWIHYSFHGKQDDEFWQAKPKQLCGLFLFYLPSKDDLRWIMFSVCYKGRHAAEVNRVINLFHLIFSLRASLKLNFQKHTVITTTKSANHNTWLCYKLHSVWKIDSSSISRAKSHNSNWASQTRVCPSITDHNHPIN